MKFKSGCYDSKLAQLGRNETICDEDLERQLAVVRAKAAGPAAGALSFPPSEGEVERKMPSADARHFTSGCCLYR